MVEERDIKTSNSNIGIKISNSNTGMKISNTNNKGLGIDLGIKEFAICSNGNKFKNIKEGRATRQNIQKQVVKVQKLHQRLRNIRTDYINKTVFSIIKQKPSYITIEDLVVSNLMKNKHLSKAIASQKFFKFKTKLTVKCKENHIELIYVRRASFGI